MLTPVVHAAVSGGDPSLAVQDEGDAITTVV